MTQRELKQKLYELVSSYFGGAVVLWGKAGAVNPCSPLVVLNMGDIIRPYQPITRIVKGVPVNSYPSQTTVQIDLYTKGGELTDADGVTAAKENTAVDDLTDFVNFLNSVDVDHWSEIHDVSIMANHVSDLTELINDAAREYRAMVELEVGFTQHAVGYGGIMHEAGMPFYENGRPKYDQDGNPLDASGKVIPGQPGPPPFEHTPSGGRTQELTDQFTGWFNEVETEFIKEED